GYHGLCSLFHRVGLCDELIIRSKSSLGLKLITSDKTLPVGKDNIISRAYETLSQHIHRRPGLNVKLIKRIPVGAGLGGGSSDAASFLVGANRLLRLGLSRNELLKLGARVGSDVPFFIEDTTFARVEGRGEFVKKLPCKRKYYLVLVAFRRGFSTKEMYEVLDKKFRQPVSLTSVRANVRICADLLNRNKLIQAKRLFHNDFLPVAEEKLNLIFKVIDTWRKQDIPCLMSGSGSSVFAVFDNKLRALEQAKRLKRQRDLKVFVAASYRHSI
ncbi:MAG: 4-(cytidine 5'-diphospho)-2-C-methyl-D-erythritol kinase, partial [Candidatus Omnitrophica bacterium]|nr:4-(cytidine 5'-diphospho)-2-C-methyl-D-erythritol kinase [Candidatus Omnitrophota bacterium]